MDPLSRLRSRDKLIARDRRKRPPFPLFRGRHHAARWMFWESEPLPETVERLRELGVRSAVFDPCGNSPEEGDFLSVMAANTAALEGLR